MNSLRGWGRMRSKRGREVNDVGMEEELKTLKKLENRKTHWINGTESSFLKQKSGYSF